MGAKSDSCGRNGRWKGLIFRHNRVHVLNQGAVLKKSSLRGVHPGDFPSRQGGNERRPISCAHSSWIKRSTLLCRKMTRVHPVVSFPLNRKSQICADQTHKIHRSMWLVNKTCIIMSDLAGCCTAGARRGRFFFATRRMTVSSVVPSS